MPDRVLVTGGAGFVGSHIVDRLVERGDEVLVVDDMSTGRADHVNDEARLEQIDIRDGGLSRVVRSFRPDSIVHAAAQASVPASMADPTRDADVNIGGGLNLARAAIDAGPAPRSSTSRPAARSTATQTTCRATRTIPFGRSAHTELSKWAFELYAHMLLAPVMRLHVLRPANVYGPRQDPHGESGVIAIFSKQDAEGRDGHHQTATASIRRDWVYAEDVARACEMASRRGRAGDRQRRVRPRHQRQRAVRFFGERDRIHSPAGPRTGAARRRPAHSALDSSRARQPDGMDGPRAVRRGPAPHRRLVQDTEPVVDSTRARRRRLNIEGTAAQWRALGFLALSTLLGMTLWFSASAVVPALNEEWDVSSVAAAWLTMSVQDRVRSRGRS